jgi:hypothetical protein
MTFRAGFMVLNVVVVYRMEHAQTGEGEVPQDLFFGVSIEEINNATMRSSTRFIFWCFH